MSNTVYAWADRLLDGKLSDILGEYLAAGMSHEQVAYALRDHDVTVSRETVRRWCNDLGLTKAAS